MRSPGANATARPGPLAVQKKLPGLYHAILDGDLKAVARQLMAGDLIFATVELPSGAGAYASRAVGINLFEFALDRRKVDCALAMLRHCTGRDAIERDARLFDLFQSALEQNAWDLARVLLKFFSVLGLRLRAKSYHLALRCVLEAGQIQLACLALNLYPRCPLTARQLSVTAHHALASQDANVVDLLLRAYPAALQTSACAIGNLLDRANGEVLAALFKHGLQLPALDRQQLGQLLERLLAEKEQHAACELLIQHKAAALPYASLLDAAIRHECEFFLKRLVQDKVSLGGNDLALVEALHGAIKRRYLDGAQLLLRHGVKFFSDPAKGVELLEKLVASGRTRTLVILIESGQVSRDMVYLGLIRHRKLQALSDLQRHFQIPFGEQVNALVRAARLSPCTGLLHELMKQMRFAAHARDHPRDRIKCAMAQAGLSYSSACNLVTLRERLMRTELGDRNHFEQQFLLAMAAYFAKMNDEEQQAWPSAQSDDRSRTLQGERMALQLLGRWVLAHATSKLLAELEAVLTRFSHLALRRSLQPAIGLPASLAHLIEAGCQETVKDATSAGDENRPRLKLALSRAILRLLKENPIPEADFNDLVSVWERAACEILMGALARMTRQAQQ